MIKGSLVALITPFKNGKIDEETFKRLVQKHKDAGTKGLVLCGSTGEGSLLSIDERKWMFETASKIVGKELSLIVGCNHFQYEELLALIDPSMKPFW